MSGEITVVGTWALTATGKRPAESSFDIGPVAHGQETAFEDDKRRVVSSSDIGPSGKYGAIVKLQIKYEKQGESDDRWAQGTGWLIKPDLLVTAGHCVYDWSYSFGKAVQIKAYTGYNGKASIGTASVQFRHGAKIATTRGWLRSSVNRANDVAFIQLNEPFKGINTLFTYKSTPVKGKLTLGVPGYPADKTLSDEKGAQMYVQYGKTTFDLASADENMLDYKISTYAGQSGSPVLIADSEDPTNPTDSIGVHVYGLSTKNSASVIKGKLYGNPFEAYIKSFERADATDATVVNGITYLNVPTPPAPETGLEEAIDEGFFDVLKKIVQVGAPILKGVLQVGSPFLGPIGGPVAAIAGTALGFAGKLAESALGSESELEVDYSHQGHAERAVLAEAALQTVLAMDQDQIKRYGIFRKMEAVYKEKKVDLKSLVPKIAPAILDPAVRLAVFNLRPEVESDLVSFPTISAPPTSGRALSEREQSFVKGLSIEANLSGHADQEGFFDFVKNFAGTGLKIVGGLAGTLGGLVGGGTESDLAPAPQGVEQHLHVLCQRALMGEAALQAIMTVPPADLKQEGFFGSLVNIIKKVAPIVIKAAPLVIKTVTPIVQAIIKGRGESAFSDRPRRGRLQPPPEDRIKKRTSIHDLLAQGEDLSVHVPISEKKNAAKVQEPQLDGIFLAPI